MGITYGRDVRRTGPSGTAPEGCDEKSWHQEASGDTGTSHTLPGRLFIVQCEWCPEAFAASTKAEAMAMFREHEAQMLSVAPALGAAESAHPGDSHHG